MKLLFCPHCHDIRALHVHRTACKCKRSWGRYVDNRIAEYGGQAVPIGIDNSSLSDAVKMGVDDGFGVDVECFLMPYGENVRRAK